MSFSASRSLQGIEIHRKVAEKEIMLVPGNPGVTFTRGDRVSMESGVLILSADSAASSIGRVVKTIVCPAASQSFPVPSVGIGDLDGAASKCLIPVEIDVPEGTKLWRGAISGYKDETVVSYVAATRAVELTTGLGTDDYGIGAIVYVYEGAGKGEVNIIEDYDHAGGAANLLVICHRAFEATLDTTSKLLILSSAAASGDGRGTMLGRMDLDDEDAFDIADGYDDGNFHTFMDFMDVPNHLEDFGGVVAINATYLIAGE